mgnify:CR=1 FL=1
MSLELIVILGIFVCACAYCSWKNGFMEGVEAGAEGALVLLEEEGIVEIHKDENGEEYVEPVQTRDDPD